MPAVYGGRKNCAISSFDTDAHSVVRRQSPDGHADGSSTMMAASSKLDDSAAASTTIRLNEAKHI